MKSISSKLFVIFLENCIRSKFCCSSVMWPKSCKGESNVVRVQQLFSYFLETGLQLWREVTNEQAALRLQFDEVRVNLFAYFFLLPKCQKSVLIFVNRKHKSKSKRIKGRVLSSCLSSFRLRKDVERLTQILSQIQGDWRRWNPSRRHRQ